MTGKVCCEVATDVSLPPNLICNFHNHRELRPLLVFSEHIALLGGGEAALRREAKLIDVGEFSSRFDPALDLVLGFELPALGGHEPKYRRSPRREEPQRLEAAGARSVVLHEITVHLDAVEQHIGDRVVGAAAHEG